MRNAHCNTWNMARKLKITEHFPIFNVADIYVTCATVIFVIVVLFYYKEEDFAFLSVKQKIQRTPNYTEDEDGKR